MIPTKTKSDLPTTTSEPYQRELPDDASRDGHQKIAATEALPSETQVPPQSSEQKLPRAVIIQGPVAVPPPSRQDDDATKKTLAEAQEKATPGAASMGSLQSIMSSRMRYLASTINRLHKEQRKKASPPIVEAKQKERKHGHTKEDHTTGGTHHTGKEGRK